MAIYYMETDENGVECVDQLDVDGTNDGQPWTVDKTAGLANRWRNTIYFEYPTE